MAKTTSGRKSAINIRTTSKLREQIEASAKENERSISEEVERRLEWSFKPETGADPIIGGYLNILGAVGKQAMDNKFSSRYSDKNWGKYEPVKRSWKSAIEAMFGSGERLAVKDGYDDPSIESERAHQKLLLVPGLQEMVTENIDDWDATLALNQFEYKDNPVFTEMEEMALISGIIFQDNELILAIRHIISRNMLSNKDLMRNLNLAIDSSAADLIVYQTTDPEKAERLIEVMKYAVNNLNVALHAQEQ